MIVLDVLVVVGGHPFDDESFFDVFDSMQGIRWTSSDTPSMGHDVVVFYDMPGFSFTRSDPPVQFLQPSEDRIGVMTDLRNEGVGLVFLHHAIAGWPLWPDYAEIIGGRFHYQPASLRGVPYPDSGYVFDVNHEVVVVEPDHPVCRNLPPTFVLTDELYCFPVFEDSVVPLMRTRFPVEDPGMFHSADLAIRSRMFANEGWSHPPGSDLVAWAKTAGEAPVVYLQFGDGPVTYANENYRLVLSNAVSWVGSAEARHWVRTKNSSE